MRIGGFLGAAILLVGCGATGPLFQTPPAPPPGYAQVIVYRMPSLASGAHAQVFWVDQTRVARLDNKGYTRFLLKAGSHEVHGGGDPNYRGLVIPISVEPGRTYYLQYVTDPGLMTITGTTPVVMNHGRLTQVTESVATGLLPEYRYQAPLVESIDQPAP
jgi:hypothetical protein